MTQPVDWPRFRSLATDDGVGELVDFYVTYTAEQLDALQAAVDAGDASAIEMLAHRIAGSNATSGTTALVAPLIELESRAHAGSLDGAAALTREARAGFERVRLFLRQQLETDASNV